MRKCLELVSLAMASTMIFAACAKKHSHGRDQSGQNQVSGQSTQNKVATYKKSCNPKNTADGNGEAYVTLDGSVIIFRNFDYSDEACQKLEVSNQVSYQIEAAGPSSALTGATNYVISAVLDSEVTIFDQRLLNIANRGIGKDVDPYKLGEPKSTLQQEKVMIGKKITLYLTEKELKLGSPDITDKDGFSTIYIETDPFVRQ